MDWDRLLMNSLPWSFLAEVALRSTIMFVVILLALKFTGKRGVRQLSIFETVFILALGSAAGDPMFYEDVGIIPALVTFVTVVILYRCVTYLTSTFKPIETFLEGKTVCLIKEGRFSLKDFKKQTLAQDEFFSELRLHQVAHLGQVQYAFLEPSGQLSIFFYPDEKVDYGLPLLPHLFFEQLKRLEVEGNYACTFCGYIFFFINQHGEKHLCPICKHHTWVKAINTPRMA